MSDVQGNGKPMVMGQASFVAVAHNAAAMFNRRIGIGDVVSRRLPDGSQVAGRRLVRAAWVDDCGRAVCLIEGFEDPISCGLVSSTANPGSLPQRKPQEIPPSTCGPITPSPTPISPPKKQPRAQPTPKANLVSGLF